MLGDKRLPYCLLYTCIFLSFFPRLEKTRQSSQFIRGSLGLCQTCLLLQFLKVITTSNDCLPNNCTSDRLFSFAALIITPLYTAIIFLPAVLTERLNRRFDLPTPIYVNMVRDPVERVISWYYYVRAPWYFVERKRAFPDLPLPNPNWLRKVSN